MWEEYLDHTERHVEIVRDVLTKLGLDPEKETPGAPAECVVHAETKDHLDWELIGMLADKAKGEVGQALKAAHGQVEDQEDERHSTARGGEGREDRHRRGPGQAGAEPDEEGGLGATRCV
jgi:hypothetical protein